MQNQPQIRVALQMEAVRIKSALDDFADLAAPRKKRNAASESTPATAPMSMPEPERKPLPQPTPTDSFDSQKQDSSQVNFFSDFDPDGSAWSNESNSFAESNNDFSPGVGEDFLDGFESEVDVPGKTGQDTLSMPMATTNQDTPANGTPKPTEAINDILDSFEW